MIEARQCLAQVSKGEGGETILTRLFSFLILNYCVLPNDHTVG